MINIVSQLKGKGVVPELSSRFSFLRRMEEFRTQVLKVFELPEDYHEELYVSLLWELTSGFVSLYLAEPVMEENSKLIRTLKRIHKLPDNTSKSELISEISRRARLNEYLFNEFDELNGLEIKAELTTVQFAQRLSSLRKMAASVKVAERIDQLFAVAVEAATAQNSEVKSSEVSNG